MSKLLVDNREQFVQGEAVSKRVKICFYVFFPAGGIGRYTHKLLKAIAQKEEASVEVACIPEFQWKKDPEYTFWDGLFSISHRIPVLRRMRFILAQFISPRRFIRYVRKNNIQVVHFSNVNHLSFPAWRTALKKTGAKIAISVHDVKRQKEIISRPWEDKQLKAVYRFADVLFVHSDYQANELTTFAGVDANKIVVVPHGPYVYEAPMASKEQLREKYGLGKDEQIALFFGQIRDEKNLEALIRALPECDKNLKLLVAGKGGGKNKNNAYYEQLAKDIGVAHKVKFISKYIPDEQVGELFVLSDWIALPYMKSFTSQSGVLNVAVNFEKPLLVCSAPVLRETIETCDVGVICSDDSPKAIVAGISQISSRMTRGYEFQFEAYRERYGWEENATRTLNAYQQLLG